MKSKGWQQCDDAPLVNPKVGQQDFIQLELKEET